MLNEAISKMPDAFESKVLLRGQEYFQKGQVLNLRLSDGLLRGRIKGSSSQIYDVHMDLKAWPRQAARCTCAYAINCKHAAACLFALRDREKVSLDQQPIDRLDRKLDSWLKNLRIQEASSSKKHEPTHHLVYLVDLRLDGHEHKVAIQLALAKILKRGGYGKKIPFNSLSESRKQHFIGEDNEIVAQLLFKCGVSGWFDSLIIRNSELLDRILATNRAFFSTHEDAPIQKGEFLEGTCEWVLTSNGNQTLVLMHGTVPIEPLILDDSWYFNAADSVMGHLQTPYPVNQLRHLLEAPPIPLDQAALLSKKMLKTCPEFPTPHVFNSRKKVEITPIPVLILDTLDDYDKDSTWFYEREEDIEAVFITRVAFDYNGLIIPYMDECNSAVSYQDEVLNEYQRDKEFESQKLFELHELLKLRAPQPWEKYNWDLQNNDVLVMEDIQSPVDLDSLYAETLPQLKNQGWRIEFASRL